MNTRTLLSHSKVNLLSVLALCGVLGSSAPRLGAFPIITNVVETGGDNEMVGGVPTDTIVAQWTGNTFPCTIAGEPVPGLTVGANYTVGLFVEDAPAHVDRAHQWNGVTAALPLSAYPYLVNQEYLMIGNDNRDNANLRLDVSVAQDVVAYLLIDNRLSDGNAADPPTFGPTAMSWVTNQNWQPVINGLNRAGSMSRPDEVGNDNNGDGVGPGGSIQDFFSVYAKFFPAGTFSLFQADNAGRGIYGVVIKVAVPPAAPTGLAAVALDTAARLRWTASPKATSYNIKRSDASGGTYTTVGTTTSLAYLDENLVNGTPYYYVVSAVSLEGEGPDSGEATVTPAAAPANLVAVGGTNEVVLGWDSLGGAASYTVQRSAVSGGPYADLAAELTDANYTDTTVAPGTTYHYAVIAELTGGGQSGLSSEAAATTAPGKPDLAAGLIAATVIKLQWTTPDSVLTDFSVERSMDGVSFAPLTMVSGTERSHLDTALDPGTTYFYRVQAVNATGPSDFSSVVSATTPAYGWNVNFAASSFATNFPGYVNDDGAVFGDRGNGFSYGWDADNSANARERNTSNSPDKRYDTLNHLQKQTPSRIWEIEIPTGYYKVHIVAGDSTAIDSTLQFDVEGVTSQSYLPTAGNWWGEFTVHCLVKDGRLTINSGPSAVNNKIGFIDIYPAELPAYAATVLGQDPIAYYRFNDHVTAPTFDTAVNYGTLGATADGIYQSLPLHGQPGALAGSADTATKFNGSSQGTAVPYSAELNPLPPFSVEGWVKPGTMRAVDSRVSPMASLRRASPAAQGWIIYQNANGWEFWMGNSTNNYTVQLSGGGAPDTNAWYHLVMTYDGATAICYVNGLEVGRTETNAFEPNPSQPLGIGMRGDAGFRFPGLVDEVAIYTNILSATDVIAHYDNGTNAAPTPAYDQLVLGMNPIAYYRLDEGAYMPKIAPNIGSLGAVANGGYFNGAADVAEAPLGPQLLGFESDNTAVQLNGSSAFVGTLVSLLNDRPAFTMSGWIRRAVDQANRAGLWGQNDLVEFGYIDNNTIQAWTDGGLNVTPNPFPNGEWDHVALVSTGPTLSLYTNGVLAASRAHTLPNGGASDFNFNIGGGGIFDGGGNFFNGQIDEVAVFGQALSPAAIANQVASAVPTAPLIVVDLPTTTNVYVGDTIVLSLSVVGTPSLRYQWFNVDGPMVDQTNAALVLLMDVETLGDPYHVEVSNDYGGPATSATCEVQVLSEPPTIVQEPMSLTVYAGATASFNVVAFGGQNMTYQWSKGGTAITDATNAMLVLSDVQPGDAGDYQVVAVNSVGSTESVPASLAVLVPQPGSYEAKVVGLGPIAYWKCNEAAGPIAYDYVGGHNGSAMGGATFAVAGPQPPSFGGFQSDNTAVQYNGTDAYVTVAPSVVNALPAFTMMGWINLAAAPANRTALWGQNDVLEFGFHTADTIGVWSPTGGYVSTAHGFSLNEWYFVAMVGDGTSMTIYVNGAPVVTGGSPVSNYGSSSHPFNIASAVLDATGNFLNGVVDEVSVYDKALTANDICGIYTAATGQPNWIQVESSDRVIADSKPEGVPHTGLNSGAAWVAEWSDGAFVSRAGLMEFTATEGDQITVSPSSDFNSTQGTIAFWMRSAGTSGTGNDGAILFDRRTSSGDVIVQTDGGQIFVQAQDSGAANSFSTTASVSDGLWHHVAYVYDQSASGSISIYIDGVLDKSQANSKAWTWPAMQQIELGRSHDGWWKLYNGMLDDLRIYNRMLTAGEIAQIHGGGDLVDATALTLLFSFDATPAGITLLWPCGTLQVADQLQGDGSPTQWTDVLGAMPPYPVSTLAPMRFYRVR